MVLMKDDPRLLECPDVIPNVKRAWAMQVWFDEARRRDCQFVDLPWSRIRETTVILWPECELEGI